MDFFKGTLRQEQKVLRDIIYEILVGGPVQAQPLIEGLMARGFSLSQIKTAKKAMGIISRKTGSANGGHWEWELQEEQE